MRSSYCLSLYNLNHLCAENNISCLIEKDSIRKELILQIKETDKLKKKGHARNEPRDMVNMKL